jgi:hypothetical protein
MVAVQRTALEDSLDGFRHVQPTASDRGVERHDAVREQPEDELRRVVAGQIVQDEQHAERRQLLR